MRRPLIEPKEPTSPVSVAGASSASPSPLSRGAASPSRALLRRFRHRVNSAAESVQSVDEGVGHVLKFFVLYFAVLYAFQTLAQLCVVAVALLTRLGQLPPLSTASAVRLGDVDGFLVFLLASEVSVQISISRGGLRGYIRNAAHVLDLWILFASVLFCCFSFVGESAKEEQEAKNALTLS